MDYALISIGTNPMWHLEDDSLLCGAPARGGLLFEHLNYTTHRRFTLRETIEFQIFSGRTVCTDCLVVARAQELLDSDEAIRGALGI